jgi:hypothetical protein
MSAWFVEIKCVVSPRLSTTSEGGIVPSAHTWILED